MRVCSVEECEKPAARHTFMCHMHIQRVRRTGITGLRDLAIPPPVRFAKLWERDPNGCWLWKGTVNRKGYGMFSPGRGMPKMVTAHRWSYFHFVGPVPGGLQLDHLCHGADLTCEGGPKCLHRRCVNPAHLDVVTAKENQIRSRHDPAQRTHCPQGHPYDEENTYRSPTGGRGCRACRAVRRRRYEERKELEHAARIIGSR